MLWIICFICSAATLCASLAAALITSLKSGKKHITPLKILAAGFFTAGFAGTFPINLQTVWGTSFAALKGVFLSAMSSAQMFVLTEETEKFFTGVEQANTPLALPYIVLLSALCLTAPLLSLGFIISFFGNISSRVKYFLNFFSDVYVFSEFNERSAALGKDLKKKPNAVIVYTNFDREQKYPFSDALEKTNALCFEKDICSVDFSKHSRKRTISFFVINDNKSQNVSISLDIIQKYKDRENTKMYVFSSRTESAMILDGNTDNGKIQVRRINEARSKIYRLLYTNGEDIFKRAVIAEKGSFSVPKAGEHVPVNIAVAGLGEYGSQMVKALIWYCRMYGFRLNLTAFEKDPLAEEKFKALCPELLSEKYNGVYTKGECEYKLTIHSGADVETDDFAKKLSEIKNLSYIFVAPGSDEMNVKTAAHIRMLTERCGARPAIQTIVYSANKIAALKSAKNFKNQRYDIDFLGDTDSFYTEEMINSAPEQEAIAIHCRRGDKESYSNIYNQRSSMARAMHIKACKAVLGAEPDSELEHRRWIAYMRSEGYIYGEQRNDLGRTHNLLVSYEKLSEDEKKRII